MIVGRRSRRSGTQFWRDGDRYGGWRHDRRWNSTSGGSPQPQTFTIITGSGIIVGTAGADIIYGSEGADTVTALQGNDQVFAGGGSDIIIAANGEGNDFYDGGLGFDTIRFDSATTGITFNLNLSDATLGDGTPVQVSTANGAEIGQDEFVRF